MASWDNFRCFEYLKNVSRMTIAGAAIVIVTKTVFPG